MLKKAIEMRKGIEWVLNNRTGYQVAKEIGVNERTISRYQTKESPIENMYFGTAEKLYKYYLEEMERMKNEMKEIYEQVMVRFNQEKANGKVWVEFYNNAEEFAKDGADLEMLDENWFIFNSKNKPSELAEPFILIDVEGSTDLPIFTSNHDTDDILDYLSSSYKKYIISNDDIATDVERGNIELDDEPTFYERERDGGADEIYIVHTIKKYDIEVIFAERDYVIELRDEIHEGTKTEEELEELLEGLNDYEDRFDYDTVVAIRADGNIEWI